jgi:hypothetical protein
MNQRVWGVSMALFMCGLVALCLPFASAQNGSYCLSSQTRPSGTLIYRYFNDAACPRNGTIISARNAANYSSPYDGFWMCDSQTTPTGYTVVETRRTSDCDVDPYISRGWAFLLRRVPTNVQPPPPDSTVTRPYCGAAGGLQVQIRGDHLFIYEGGRQLVTDVQYAAGAQSTRGATFDCSDIVTNGSTLVAARLGHKNDILHLFFFERNGGAATRVSVLIWAVRDGEVTALQIAGLDIIFNTGRKSDLRYRLCPNWQGRFEEWGIYGSRGGTHQSCNSSFGAGPNKQGGTLVKSIPASL